MKFLLGTFEVIKIGTAGEVTIALDSKIRMTLYLGELPHALSVGDRLPLYTEFPTGYKELANALARPVAS